MKRIKLSQGKFTIVDDRDFKFLSGFRWHLYRRKRKHGDTLYAVRNSLSYEGLPKRSIRMHREILRTNLEVDHCNGNGLDNRRLNLRKATPTQNRYNTPKRWGASKYKGVAWNKNARKWEAYITVDRSRIYLGLFDSQCAAARSYNRQARKFHGEFARLNKIN